MTPEQEQWHKIRASHIGGSEIAIIMGYPQYGKTKYQLWHEKKGNVQRDDLSGDKRVNAGNFMEPAIAAWASSYFGDPLVKANVYAKHPTVVGMGSTPDYFKAGTNYPVEIKNVDGFIFYKDWEAAGDVITDAPMAYILQTMHTMDCLEEPEGKLIAGIGGNRLAQMVIQRREEIVTAIHESVNEFWQSIKDNKPPEPDYKMDAEVISKLRRKGDKTPIDMSENEVLMNLCADYEAAKVWADSWKNEKKGIGAQILEICNGHNVVTCGIFKLGISDIPSTPGKMLSITPDMIGTEVRLTPAKNGYPRLKVKNTEKPTDEEEE